MLLERQTDGRYPQRLASQAAWLLPLVEYVRQTMISAAQESGRRLITPIARLKLFRTVQVGTGRYRARGSTLGLPVTERLSDESGELTELRGRDSKVV